MSESPSSATGVPARLAALALLKAALARRGGLDEALNLPEFSRLDPADRAFARALAMATLRRLGPIDRALAARLVKAPPPDVVDLLRLGAGELFGLRTPAFAAVSTMVRLAQRSGALSPFKGLINAVLRGLARDGGLSSGPEANAPDWVFARWAAFYGRDAALAMAAEIPREPPTDLACRDPAEAPELATALGGQVLPGGGVRVRGRGDVSGWPGFTEGRWWVQDVAASIPARLLAPRPEEPALDLCAAPGGKSLQLAAAGAKVTAVDRSATRLGRLDDNLGRTGLAAEVVTADAETWEDGRSWAAVLLDAPCSATGTFRRNPETLWATRPADIAKLADVQHRLLDAAAARVAPGGRLVYCVCSLEREEGEGQIPGFLRRHPDFAVTPAQAEELGIRSESVTAEGYVRLLPHQGPADGGQDGFFAVRLQRRP